MYISFTLCPYTMYACTIKHPKTDRWDLAPVFPVLSTPLLNMLNYLTTVIHCRVSASGQPTLSPGTLLVFSRMGSCVYLLSILRYTWANWATQVSSLIKAKWHVCVCICIYIYTLYAYITYMHTYVCVCVCLAFYRCLCVYITYKLLTDFLCVCRRVYHTHTHTHTRMQT